MVVGATGLTHGPRFGIGIGIGIGIGVGVGVGVGRARSALRRVYILCDVRKVSAIPAVSAEVVRIAEVVSSDDGGVRAER